MSEDVEASMFKKLLGVRTLIKSAVELDQPILHYCAYAAEEKLWELTVVAQAQTSLAPFWHFKLMLSHKDLERVVLIIFKMIEYYDSIIKPQDKKLIKGGSNSGLITKPE